MSNEKSDINQIDKAPRNLENDTKKATELLQLPWEYMHEDWVFELW